MQKVFSNKKTKQDCMRNALKSPVPEHHRGEDRKCKCALVNKQMKEKQVLALRGGGMLGTH